MAVRTWDCRGLGSAAKALRVGWRKRAERGVGEDMEVNGVEDASSARKMTVLWIRVNAWGFGRVDELAMPYGMLLMPKCEA
mgnify:CR=1 FL=1